MKDLEVSLAEAGRQISAALGYDVELVPRSDTSIAVVICALSPGRNGAAPPRVALKRFPDGLDVNDPSPWGPGARFLNGWAGLELLARVLPGEQAVSPRLLAASREHGFLVTEYCAAANLELLLLGEDAGAARRGLLELGRTLGRIQAVSRGREPEYESLRRRLGPLPSPAGEMPLSGGFFRQKVERLKRNLAALGVDPAPGFQDELEDVATHLDDPGPFLAYVHGDPGASNFLFDTSRGGCLIDFEFGRFAHGLCDATFARMMFPTSWNVNRLPEELVEEFEAVFWEEWQKGDRSNTDRKAFERGLLEMSVFWLVQRMAASLEGSEGNSNRRQAALDADQPWGISTIRQIVTARLHAFLRTAEAFDGFPAVARTCQELSHELRRLWGDVERMPLFPAFRKR